MKLTLHDTIHDFSPAEWNALLSTGYPFMRHEFLAALEDNQCTGERFGWLPRYFALRDDGELKAALPVFEKNNSYGEFVFDWNWADAYQRNGMPYYPKWVLAAPYTPVGGPRLLTHPSIDRAELLPQLAQMMIDACPDTVSSIHCLFAEADELESMQACGYMLRSDIQFHWHNQGYDSFESFLQTLTSKKRKNIRQERRYAQHPGIDIEVIHGHEATEQQLIAAELFYRITFDRKWGTPTLNLGFFQQIADTMGEQLVLIMARQQDEYVAGSILFRDEHALYGRHWGCLEHQAHLHFECCFYRGIEYCIEHKLQLFHPGAQGEHKISRGFLPTITRSAHWIRDPGFGQAIARFLEQETEAILDYASELNTRSPYRSTDD